MSIRPYLIAIAGPSCSGKSELSRWLARELSAPILPLDAYYRDQPGVPLERRSKMNFDEPVALDELLIFQHLEQLAAGRPIDRPIYDFTTHQRAPAVQRIEPERFVLVEGLFALHWERARRLCGTKVYIETADHVCFDRRLARDVRERGRTPESVRSQYDSTVRPMATLYIRPTRHFADTIVSGVEPLDRSGGTVLTHLEGHVSRAKGAAAD